MTTDVDNAREDLAFLRGLVEENPGPGVWMFGALYVTIGATVCVHVLMSALLEGRALVAALVALYAVAGVLWQGISLRFRAMGGAGAGVKSRAGGAVLAGALIAHVVMLAVFVILAWRWQIWMLMQLAPVVLIVSQGMVWLVSAALQRQGWHGLLAAGWFLSALALAPLVGTEAFGSALCGILLVLMIIPGVLLMRAARKTA